MASITINSETLLEMLDHLDLYHDEIKNAKGPNRRETCLEYAKLETMIIRDLVNGLVELETQKSKII